MIEPKQKLSKMREWLVIRHALLLLFVPFSMNAQTDQTLTIKVPEGSIFTTLSNDDGGSFVSCIASNCQGVIYYAIQNNVLSIKDNQQIELPKHFRPISMCWTNNEKFVLFANDTLFIMDNGLFFRPLLSAKTSKPIVRPIGEEDIAFCMVNDTVLYRYFTQSDSLAPVVSLNLPIRDFIVDNEDYYIAYGNRLVAFTQEEEYIPILIDAETITNIAFCGSSSFLLSTPSGLWYVNDKREKELLFNQPIINIITDDFDRAFIMLQDGTWLFLFPVSSYETEQE